MKYMFGDLPKPLYEYGGLSYFEERPGVRIIFAAINRSETNEASFGHFYKADYRNIEFHQTEEADYVRLLRIYAVAAAKTNVSTDFCSLCTQIAMDAANPGKTQRHLGALSKLWTSKRNRRLKRCYSAHSETLRLLRAFTNFYHPNEYEVDDQVFADFVAGINTWQPRVYG